MKRLKIKESLFSVISAAIVCPCCLSAFIFSHDAMAGTLVVVPAGLEQVEGNRLRGKSAHPDPNDTVLFQHVYPASEFLGVPAGQHDIVAMRLRPDKTVDYRKEVEIGTYELRLSTTDAVPGTLDLVLDQNRGDDDVVVYSGPITWETDGAGPPEGPQAFDYVVDFQDAFPYDPSGGRSLLVEEIFIVLPQPILVDAHLPPGGEGVRWQAALPHTAGVAGGQAHDAWIRQFEFVPLAGDFDGNGVLDVEDVNLLQQAIVAGSPGAEFDLNSDESVDDADVRIWVKDLRNTWIGDADLNGEFNSSDMVQVFAAGKYETGQEATWAEGNWDTDPIGVFDSSDMVAAFADGGYEKGPRTDAVAVPEPTSVLLLLTGLIAVAVWQRRRRW